MTATIRATPIYRIERRMHDAGLNFAQLSRQSGVAYHRLRYATALSEWEQAAAEVAIAAAQTKREATRVAK